MENDSAMNVDDHIEMVSVTEKQFKFRCPIDGCGKEIVNRNLGRCRFLAGQHMEHKHKEGGR